METKRFTKSLTVKGAALALVPAFTLVLRAANVEIHESEATELLNALFAVGSIVLVIVGRLKANTKLTLK